jgi:hypothetical protein
VCLLRRDEWDVSKLERRRGSTYQLGGQDPDKYPAVDHVIFDNEHLDLDGFLWHVLGVGLKRRIACEGLNFSVRR